MSNFCVFTRFSLSRNVSADVKRSYDHCSTRQCPFFSVAPAGTCEAVLSEVNQIPRLIFQHFHFQPISGVINLSFRYISNFSIPPHNISLYVTSLWQKGIASSMHHGGDLKPQMHFYHKPSHCYLMAWSLFSGSILLHITKVHGV